MLAQLLQKYLNFVFKWVHQCQLPVGKVWYKISGNKHKKSLESNEILRNI